MNFSNKCRTLLWLPPTEHELVQRLIYGGLHTNISRTAWANSYYACMDRYFPGWYAVYSVVCSVENRVAAWPESVTRKMRTRKFMRDAYICLHNAQPAIDPTGCILVDSVMFYNFENARKVPTFVVVLPGTYMLSSVGAIHGSINVMSTDVRLHMAPGTVMDGAAPGRRQIAKYGILNNLVAGYFFYNTLDGLCNCTLLDWQQIYSFHVTGNYQDGAFPHHTRLPICFNMYLRFYAVNFVMTMHQWSVGLPIQPDYVDVNTHFF